MMLVLITYDVETCTPEGKRRLRLVAKECVNFGHRVQNSVFECLLSESQMLVLKNKLQSIIDLEADSIRFYQLGKNWNRKVQTMGKDYSLDFNSELIV